MTLKEFKELINYFDSGYDDVQVLIDSYQYESPMYDPTNVQMDCEAQAIRISLEIAD